MMNLVDHNPKEIKDANESINSVVISLVVKSLNEEQDASGLPPAWRACEVVAGTASGVRG